jgi:Ca2+-binding EF-hand superfamily protein
MLFNKYYLPLAVDKHVDPPTIEEICEMFEFLDEGRSGMIAGEDLLNLLELSERLKTAQFD